MARWDASVQHLGLAEVCVEIEGRLFLCAGCRAQVLLCSRCDRGNRYCDRTCWRRVHDAARREAADRYQRSYRGRHAHAARTRRWRERRVECAQNVTHQGSPARRADASLLAWTHDCTASALDDVTDVASNPVATDTTALSPAPACIGPWRCRHCGGPLSACVRQDFLRHRWRAVRRAGRRDDHSP